MSELEQNLADLKMEIQRLKEQHPSVNWFFVDYELTRLASGIEDEVEIFEMMEAGR